MQVLLVAGLAAVAGVPRRAVAARAGPRREPVSEVAEAVPESSALSAQATAVPEAMAAPTPNAIANAPIRPTCIAAFLGEFINSLLLGE